MRFSEDRMWEYKALGSNELFGPFTTSQVRDWVNQGYFKGDTAVMIRRVSASPEEFVSSDSIDWNNL